MAALFRQGVYLQFTTVSTSPLIYVNQLLTLSRDTLAVKVIGGGRGVHSLADE